MEGIIYIFIVLGFYLIGGFLAFLKYRKPLMKKNNFVMDWICIIMMSWLSVIDDRYIYSIIFGMENKKKK